MISKETKTYTISLISFTVFLVILSITNILFLPQPTLATIDDSKCQEFEGQEKLDCLEDYLSSVQEERENVEAAIEQEQAKQNSLQYQINKLESEISMTQLDIKTAKINIEQKNVEISLLDKEIQSKQTEIATTKQEIQSLEDSVQTSASEIYKTLCIDDIEIMLGNQDMWNNINDVKYVQVVREQDKNLLTDLDEKYIQLQDYQKILSEKKEEDLVKKSEIEAKHTELENLETQLGSQKTQRADLLAQSQQKEASYSEDLSKLQAIESEANKEVAQLIMELYQKGQLGNGTVVEKGDAIGVQGHTGCSFGSHLHYSVNDGTLYNWWGYFWGNVNPYNYLTDSIPLKDARVTQGYHQGKSIDLVSETEGNQLDDIYGACWDNPTQNQCYYVNPGDIPCSPGTSGWFPLQGEGAPIRAIMPGTVYYGTESAYGAKFAMIEHDNGYVSIYLHLK